MAEAPQPAGLTDEQIVKAVRGLVKPGEDAHRLRTRRFDRCYDIYRSKADTRDTNQANVPAWRARTRIPYAQYVVDTEVVGITSGLPRCVVHPRRAQDVLAAKAMQMVMDHYVAEDHLAEKQARVAQQALVYGVAGAKNTWGYAEQMRAQRVYLPDPAHNDTLRPVVQAARYVAQDGPCFEPWDVYDMVWDPNARDVDSARYIILRSWVTKDYLLENERTEANPNGLYRNVQDLLDTGSAPTKRQDTAQEIFYGGSQNKRKDMILLEEVWTDAWLLVIGNGQVLVRSEANPYWHGRKPIVVAQTRPDMFEMQGIPEVDMVSDIQSTMQTLQNMILDALKLTVLRGVTVRAGSVADPAMINLRPNFKWLVTDHDDIRPFEVPQLGSDVYNMLTSLLGDMERVTGVSAYLTGADSSTINQTTATGVTALQSAANTQLKFKAQQLHNKVFQRTFEQWGDLIQQFMSDSVELEVTGDDGKKVWVRVDPEQVLGHFRFRLEGSEESLSRQQERTEALGLLNAVAPFAQLGVVNLDEVLKKVAASFDILPPESILKPPPPALPPAAPNGGQQFPAGQFGGGPPGPPGMQPPMPNGAPLPLGVQQAITGR